MSPFGAGLHRAMASACAAFPAAPATPPPPGGACVNLPAVLPAAAASQLMTSPFATSPMGALTLAERLAGMPHRTLNV